MAGYGRGNEDQTGYHGRRLSLPSNQPPPPGPPPGAECGSSAASGSYNGSYTVFAPNQQKRQQILQGAQREEELYQISREQSRLTQVSASGVVGGGRMSEDDVRQLQQRENAQALKRSKAKRDAARAEDKRREEEEYQKIKEEGHRKAERKAAQDREREERQKLKLADEHKRKNDDFLSRLEGKPKIACEAPVLTASATLAATTSSTSATLVATTSSASATLAATTSSTSIILAATTSSTSATPSTSATLAATTPAAVQLSGVSTPSTRTLYPSLSRVEVRDAVHPPAEDQLRELQYIFPDHSRETLTEMLRLSGYNMEAAAELLMG